MGLGIVKSKILQWHANVSDLEKTQNEYRILKSTQFEGHEGNRRIKLRCLRKTGYADQGLVHWWVL